MGGYSRSGLPDKNRCLGGQNATGFGYAAALMGATVEVDGKNGGRWEVDDIAC
jgi:hypothetical protein